MVGLALGRTRGPGLAADHFSRGIPELAPRELWGICVSSCGGGGGSHTCVVSVSMYALTFVWVVMDVCDLCI